MFLDHLFLDIAGLLMLALAVIHSGLGERLIFSRWRKSPPDIPARHRGIIRASWHALSLLAIAMAVPLLYFPTGSGLPAHWRWSWAAAIALSAVLVLIWTRGRHPGWIVMGVIAALIALS